MLWDSKHTHTAILTDSYLKLFQKSKGTLGQKVFSARVVDLWN